MDTSKLKQLAPLGLTIGGCLGVVGAVIFSHKDTLKAQHILADKDFELHGKEKTKAVWKCYIPTGLMSMLAIGCTTAAYVFKEKQYAALAGGLALTGSLLNEYKDAIKEKFGKEGLDDITRKVAEPYESEIISSDEDPDRSVTDKPEEGNTLFYDSLLHIWFKASKDAFDVGRYILNKRFKLGWEVSIRDLYEFMCVPLDGDTRDIAESLVWGFDENNGFMPWTEWIDIGLVSAETKEGTPYYIIEYEWEPMSADVLADYTQEYEENRNESQ